MIVKLEEPFIFTDSVKAICLSGNEDIKPGERAVLAGWGRITGYLLQLFIKIIYYILIIRRKCHTNNST